MSKYASLIASSQVACKGCGITLTIPENENQVRCPYCGSVSERVMSSGTPQEWLAQAELACNSLRFDEAQFYYRLILRDNPESIDALWGMIRCRFGVQFVLDDSERTEGSDHAVYVMCAKRVTVPVDETDEVHELRNALDRIAADRRATEEDRKKAERMRGYIGDVREQQQFLLDYWMGGAEKDFDIFLCCQDRLPEKDAWGQVTGSRPSPDSEWVHRFYEELMRQIQAQKLNIRVFYPPVTTKSFAGSSFAAVYAHALFSSRMMLLMGTSREAFDLPWIKAERERFAWLIDEYRMNRLIIPIMNASRAPDVSYKSVFPPVYGKVTAISFRNEELVSCVASVIQRVRDLWKKDDPRDHFRRSAVERDYARMRAEFGELRQERDALRQERSAQEIARREAERVRDELAAKLEEEQAACRELEDKLKGETAIRRNAESRERESNGLYIDLTMNYKRLEAANRETESALEEARASAARTEQTLAESRSRGQQLQKALDDAEARLRGQSDAYDRQREEAIRLDSMLKSRDQEIQHLRESSALQLNIEQQAHQRDRDELKDARDNLTRVREELDAAKRELARLRAQSGGGQGAAGDQRTQPPSPRLRLMDYGFAATGSNGVPEYYGPDLNQAANLRHPERIRAIVLSLRAEQAMRVSVQLQHRPSETNDTRQASLRPKMVSTVAFDIDPTKLSAYDGAFQVTVTAVNGEQLLRQEVQLTTLRR